jgi:hypothetical protein
MTLGRTSAGRYLPVIYSPDEEPESVFVVTAYEMHDQPVSRGGAMKTLRGKSA